MTTPQPPERPAWERRLRAPGLATFSLFGPTVAWAAVDDRGALLADLTGRIEAHAFDARAVPATLRQLTDRVQGTLAVRVSPDGRSVLWFDDHHGDELGRWVRQDLPEGELATGPLPTPVTLLPGLPPAYGVGGAAALDGGRAVVGRLLDGAFEVAVVEPDGSGEVVHRSPQMAFLADVTPDGSHALLSFPPDGDWQHLGLRVVRLADGQAVAELVEPGRSLQPVGFGPAAGRDPVPAVLLTDEPDGRRRPVVWQPGGDMRVVDPGLPGDVEGLLQPLAWWWPDGGSLLLADQVDGRHSLHRHDLATGDTRLVADGLGVVAAASPRPDGSVHALVSKSDRPPSLVRITDGRATPLVVLPEEPPPAPAATDVRADGPAGPVHALLTLPARGRAPYPAVFLVHGGPTAQDVDAWSPRTAALTDLGYAVVQVNYRGSTGYGAAWRDALRHRVGFIELEDVAAVRDRLLADGLLDPARLSIAGGSWGGYLTLMALGTQPAHWRSGVAMVPLADWALSVEDAPAWMTEADAWLFGGTIEELPEAYHASSPLTYVDAVTAPLLVTAGENDPRCPVRPVDVYVDALRARGHDVRYDRQDAGHWLPDVELAVAQLRQVLDFLVETNPPG